MKLSAIINIHDFLIAFNAGNKTDAGNIMVGSKLLINAIQSYNMYIYMHIPYKMKYWQEYYWAKHKENTGRISIGDFDKMMHVH